MKSPTSDTASCTKCMCRKRDRRRTWGSYEIEITIVRRLHSWSTATSHQVVACNPVEFVEPVHRRECSRCKEAYHCSPEHIRAMQCGAMSSSWSPDNFEGLIPELAPESHKHECCTHQDYESLVYGTVWRIFLHHINYNVIPSFPRGLIFFFFAKVLFRFNLCVLTRWSCYRPGKLRTILKSPVRTPRVTVPLMSYSRWLVLPH